MTELINRNECNIKIVLKYVTYRVKIAMLLKWKGDKTLFKKQTNNSISPILAFCPSKMNSHQVLYRNSCHEQRMPTSFYLALSIPRLLRKQSSHCFYIYKLIKASNEQ